MYVHIYVCMYVILRMYVCMRACMLITHAQYHYRLYIVWREEIFIKSHIQETLWLCRCIHHCFTQCICDCGFVFIVFDLLEIMKSQMSETPGASTLIDEHHCFMPIFVW